MKAHLLPHVSQLSKHARRRALTGLAFIVLTCDAAWPTKPQLPLSLTSHPKNSKTGLLQGRVQSRTEAESQHHTGVGGIDDAVVPESAGTKKIPFIDRRTAHYASLL